MKQFNVSGIQKMVSGAKGYPETAIECPIYVIGNVKVVICGKYINLNKITKL